MADGQRLSGINPLAYMGVEPYSPPQLVIFPASPTTGDTNFRIGTLWVVKEPTPELWMLMSVAGGTAVWVELYPGGVGGATNFPTDNGTAIESAGNLQIVGQLSGGNLVKTDATHGPGNRVTVALTNGSNGQVPIGGGIDPEWADVTSSDGTLTIGRGPNILDLLVTNPGGARLRGNDTIVVDPGVGNVIDVVGYSILETEATGAHELTIKFVDPTDEGVIPIGSFNNDDERWGKLTTDGSIIITPSTPAGGPYSIQLSTKSLSKTYAFMAYLGSNVLFKPIDSVTPWILYLGGYSQALTISYDAAGTFTGGDGIASPAAFTAPVNGVYEFTVTAMYNNFFANYKVAPCAQIICVPPAGPNQVFSSRPVFFSYSAEYDAQDIGMTVTAQVSLVASSVVNFALFIPGMPQEPASMELFGTNFGSGSASYPDATQWTWVSGKLVENL